MFRLSIAVVVSHHDVFVGETVCLEAREQIVDHGRHLMVPACGAEADHVPVNVERDLLIGRKVHHVAVMCKGGRADACNCEGGGG